MGVIASSHRRHGQDKTRLSGLVRVDGVNTTGDKTRQFCLVSTQFPISIKFPVVLNIFETEQLQIGNWVKMRQNCLVLSPILLTPPTRTRQYKTSYNTKNSAEYIHCTHIQPVTKRSYTGVWRQNWMYHINLLGISIPNVRNGHMLIHVFAFSISYLTLSFPHLCWLWQNESTNAFTAIPTNFWFFDILALWRSGLKPKMVG